MTREIFDEASTMTLLSPEKWTLVTDFLPAKPEPDTGKNSRRAAEKKMSRHAHRELLVALKGKYVYGFNGKCYNCEPGSIFLIDSNVEHELCYTQYSRNLLHMWLFVLEDRVFGNCLEINKGKMENRFKILFRDFLSSMNIFRQWDALRESAGTTREPLEKRKFLLSLGCLFLRIIESGTPSEPDLDDYQKEMIEITKGRIQKGFRHGINIEQLARSGGYSKFHFLRLFRKYSGCTIHEYLNKCRMNEMEKLFARKYSLKEIAGELGFSCLPAFSNWRKKMMENRNICSPSSTKGKKL